MMQYACGFDPVEGAADRTQLQNISLRVFDVMEAVLARLALRISETLSC